MFLKINVSIDEFNNDDKEFSISFSDNAFTDFVELPSSEKDLIYANVICGIIRGAFKTVSLY